MGVRGKSSRLEDCECARCFSRGCFVLEGLDIQVLLPSWLLTMLSGWCSLKRGDEGCYKVVMENWDEWDDNLDKVGIDWRVSERLDCIVARSRPRCLYRAAWSARNRDIRADEQTPVPLLCAQTLVALSLQIHAQ